MQELLSNPEFGDYAGIKFWQNWSGEVKKKCTKTKANFLTLPS